MSREQKALELQKVNYQHQQRLSGITIAPSLSPSLMNRSLVTSCQTRPPPLPGAAHQAAAVIGLLRLANLDKLN